jgi:hypothetical protein
MEQNDRSYKSEEEKAMRFQLFKATVHKLARPPETLNCFADWTEKERWISLRSCKLPGIGELWLLHDERR